VASGRQSPKAAASKWRARLEVGGARQGSDGSDQGERSAQGQTDRMSHRAVRHCGALVKRCQVERQL
jgi:hypothetical protein